MYDFDDPEIKNMVAEDHHPKETFTVNVAGFAQSNGIRCDRCSQEWPCPPIVQLRKFQERKAEEEKKRFGEMVREAQTRPPIIMLPHE